MEKALILIYFNIFLFHYYILTKIQLGLIKFSAILLKWSHMKRNVFSNKPFLRLISLFIQMVLPSIMSTELISRSSIVSCQTNLQTLWIQFEATLLESGLFLTRPCKLVSFHLSQYCSLCDMVIYKSHLSNIFSLFFFL